MESPHFLCPPTHIHDITETWPEAKASGRYLFGQVPALELEDGTVMVQTPAIVQVGFSLPNLFLSVRMVCNSVLSCDLGSSTS